MHVRYESTTRFLCAEAHVSAQSNAMCISAVVDSKRNRCAIARVYTFLCEHEPTSRLLTPSRARDDVNGSCLHSILHEQNTNDRFLYNAKHHHDSVSVSVMGGPLYGAASHQKS